MYRTALRSAPSALRAVRPNTFASSRRLASTSAAAANKGTWKGTGLRWGLAIAAVYFYNTSPIFADELPVQTATAPSPFSDADLPTVDALIEKKRRQAEVAAPPPPPPQQEEATTDAVEAVAAEGASDVPAPAPGSPEALEEEADQQGAFNPETGEINWECPCLGGMADGPCGEEFKAAFSCFVYSKEEPKGMDCIDKFQHMQDCFRKFPEIYGSELGDNEEEGAAPSEGHEVAKATEAEAPADKEEVKKSAAEEPIPNEAFDATDANKSKKE